jgi:RNA polymerase sigma-70 factor (ECF subfamily)
LIMLWLDECSYDEIAQILGVPRNTVATRLHRVKERLAAMVK